MLRPLFLALLAAVLLVGVGRWVSAPGTGTSTAADPSSAAIPRSPSSPGGDEAEPAPPPPGADPEELAAWFQEDVVRRLQRSPSGRRGTDVAAGPRADARVAEIIARHGLREGAAQALRERDVDWAYLDDVFSGRVSGVPNERKAGLSLVEMDLLGTVPYLAELRHEARVAELEDLGFENEPGMEPWPACLRTGTCGRYEAYEKSD